MMKKALLLLVVGAAWSVSTFAADTSAASGEVIRTVARLEFAYPPGQVVAIALDDSGDKAPHYHVDMRYPHGDVARLDVDAATGAIAARDRGAPGSGWATLADASTTAGWALPGQVVAAELDADGGATAHYDVDVRLPSGDMARLKVDPASLAIGWRTPPVVAQ